MDGCNNDVLNYSLYLNTYVDLYITQCIDTGSSSIIHLSDHPSIQSINIIARSVPMFSCWQLLY